MVLHTIADLIVGESKRLALRTPQGVSGAGTTSHGRCRRRRAPVRVVSSRLPYAELSVELRSPCIRQYSAAASETKPPLRRCLCDSAEQSNRTMLPVCRIDGPA